MRYLALALLFVVHGDSGQGQSSSPPEDASRAGRIDALFAEYDRRTSPGCAVAVYEGNRISYQKAYGMANLDHDVRLTPSSVFHVASVSKQFTATAILLLAQDGKLSVDDDIRKHLPELPDFGKTITIRHLAHHTSGIRDQWDLLSLAGWRYSRDLITDDDVMELLTRQKDLNFAPGERHLYSNSGYTLMARIVSRVSGRSFREFTDERIFKPLGMSSTHFRDNFGEIVKNQAYGYAPERGSFRLSVTNFDTAGATSLLTTVEDLLKWHANFDSRKVGGDALHSALLERGVLTSGRQLDYALGISHDTYRGVPAVGHGGSDAGYRAHFIRFPDRRLGVAVLCNIATANPGLLARRVADAFLPDNLPPARTEPSGETSPGVPVPEPTLRGYAGLYWNQDEAIVRTVVLDGGSLYLVNERQRSALKPTAGGTFVMTGGPQTRLAFETGPNGVMQLTTADGTQIFVKTEPFTPSAEERQEFAGLYRSDEMDAVFRIEVRDGVVQLERSRLRPTPLLPLVKDSFRAQPGVMQFTRDSAGRVTGFVLQGGRVKNMKFWRDTAGPRSSSSQTNR